MLFFAALLNLETALNAFLLIVVVVYTRKVCNLGQAAKLRHGAQIKDWHFAPGTYRVYSITGEFLLLGKVENTILTTIKSFFEV